MASAHPADAGAHQACGPAHHEGASVRGLLLLLVHSPGRRDAWRRRGTPLGRCRCRRHGRPTPAARPPGWGCPVNKSMEESFCNNRTDPRQQVCFPDLLTLGTALDAAHRDTRM